MEDSPPCPQLFKCTLTKLRMHDPVIAQDSQTYERAAILKWFNNGNTTSPITHAQMRPEIMANEYLKKAIEQWVTNNPSENGGAQQLERLKMEIFSVTTVEAALSILQQLLNLITKSNILLLSLSEALSFRGLLGYKNLLTEPVNALLLAMSRQCNRKIAEKTKQQTELEQ